jgi:LysM repeat protein
MPTPSSTPTTYTVRAGDSLGAIAARFGTTVQAFVAANAERYPSLASRPDHIQIGWTLTVPGASEPETTGGEPRPNDDILYVGMNPGSTYEARALRATGAKVTAIHDAPEPDRARAAGGQTYDLATPEGASAFAATFGLPPEQTERVAHVIHTAFDDARDELGRIAEAWAPAERGGSIPSRLVLSGHSVGRGVWGDENGTLTLDAVGRLAEAMPEAARRVEDVHIAGCYSGGEYAIERFRAMFPKVKTVWAYSGSAPIAGPIAARHEQLWEAATRGRRDDLDRAIAGRAAGGESVAVWTVTGGYQDGQPPRPLEDVKSAFERQEPTFDRYFRGEEMMTSPQSGALRDYYNALQAYLQHPDLPADARPALEAKRDVTIRLIYYAATVAKKFALHYADAIRTGFAALGLPAPDFATLSRRDALAHVSTFEGRVRAASPPPESAASLLPALTEGLVALDPSVIPDAWV